LENEGVFVLADISSLAGIAGEHGPVAAVVALVTVVLTKVVDHILAKRTKVEDTNLLEGTVIRAELREEVTQLKADFRELLAEIDQWRDRYLQTREELGVARVDLHAKNEALRTMHRVALSLATALEESGEDVDPATWTMLEELGRVSGYLPDDSGG